MRLIGLLGRLGHESDWTLQWQEREHGPGLEHLIGQVAQLGLG